MKIKILMMRFIFKPQVVVLRLEALIAINHFHLVYATYLTLRNVMTMTSKVTCGGQAMHMFEFNSH